MLALVCLTVSLEFLQGISLGNLLADDGLLLARQLTHFVLNCGEVALLDHLSVGQQHVIEETVLYGRTKAELNARIQLLQCFG